MGGTLFLRHACLPQPCLVRCVSLWPSFALQQCGCVPIPPSLTCLRDPPNANTAFESGVEVRAPERELVQPGLVPPHLQRGRARRSDPGEPRVRLGLASFTPAAARGAPLMLLMMIRPPWMPSWGNEGSVQAFNELLRARRGFRRYVHKTRHARLWDCPAAETKDQPSATSCISRSTTGLHTGHLMRARLVCVRRLNCCTVNPGDAFARSAILILLDTPRACPEIAVHVFGCGLA